MIVTEVRYLVRKTQLDEIRITVPIDELLSTVKLVTNWAVTNDINITHLHKCFLSMQQEFIQTSSYTRIVHLDWVIPIDSQRTWFTLRWCK